MHANARSVLKSLTADEWLEVARLATGAPIVDVRLNDVQPLQHAILTATTAGVWRVKGKAIGRSSERSFSVILKKIVRPLQNKEFWSPKSFNYWKAEALAYESEALKKAQGLRAPECYFIKKDGADSIGLFLEDVTGDHQWNRKHYLQLLAGVARFNVQKSISGIPRRNWFASLVRAKSMISAIVENESMWENQHIRRVFPQSPVSEFRKVLAGSRRRLDELKGLPHGPSHLDLQASNMFRMRRRDAVPVVIDWAFFSMAPLGADVGQFISQVAMWLLVPFKELPDFVDEAVGTYVHALGRKERGVSAKTIERCIRRTAALRLAYNAPFFIRGLAQATGRKTMEYRIGRPWADVAFEWGQAISFVLKLE